ncbi:MAG: DUF3347 domain-containing protein [Vicinamibacteraceae bacterium]|nr:DUF3347 domain-containing protein [Vicinamibacteraceae bacterium]
MPRRFLAALVVVCAAALGAATLAADFAQSVVEPYLRIQTALAADRMDGVKADAAAIAKAAGAMGPRGATIAGAARELRSAGSVAGAREAFGKLSDALIAYGTVNKGSLGPATRKAYCPMEKQYWLQKGTTIANPYAGKRMLRCGEFKAL